MNSRSLARSVRRFYAGDSRVKRVLIRLAYSIFIVQPYPLRRVTTAVYIASVLQLKRILGVERQTEPTPMDEVGTLSFWGVPTVDAETFTLTLDGWVERPQVLRFDELLAMPSEQRTVRMDCVGGFRNNTTMRGVPLAALLERAGPRAGARRAIFSCADGYFESSTLADLAEAEAMIAYEIDGQRVARLGHPLRLAIPGAYGYKWAKWVQRIEIVTHDRKGYWPQRGLPDRARVGDIW